MDNSSLLYSMDGWGFPRSYLRHYEPKGPWQNLNKIFLRFEICTACAIISAFFMLLLHKLTTNWTSNSRTLLYLLCIVLFEYVRGI